MDWTASAQKILVVGYARESLLALLDARGCAITCVVLTGGTSLDEARVFCPVVHAAAAEKPSLPTIFKRTRFDAVVLDGALDLAANPAEVIMEGRSLVSTEGVLVALFSDDAAFEQLFDAAGCSVERFDSISDPRDTARYAVLARPKPAPGRQELRSRLDAAVAEIERLAVGNSSAAARIKELEREALRGRITMRGLRSDLEAEKIGSSSLQKLLDDKVRALSELRKAVAETEDMSRALYTDSEALRARTIELEAEVASARAEAQKHSDRAERMTAAEAATNSWAEILQGKVADLHGQIAAQTASEQEARDQLGREVEVRERLTRELEERRYSVSETERRLGEEIRELRARVAEAEQTLTSQTDALVDSMRAEGSKLSTMIDTVQSSRFWRFKRWLGRLRGGASL